MVIRFFQRVRIYKKLLSIFSGVLVLAGCAAQNPLLMTSAPAPPQVVCECGVPWETYLIFFTWDGDALTPRGRHIATLTADDSKKQGFRPITVSGYADTSGSSAYNLKLSLRRARIVAKLLIAEGIPAKWITVQAYGDTRLLIPTGSGVRQEQNRRVEIIRATADPNDPNS